jgi:hypothetical protein
MYIRLHDFQGAVTLNELHLYRRTVEAHERARTGGGGGGGSDSYRRTVQVHEHARTGLPLLPHASSLDKYDGAKEHVPSSSANDHPSTAAQMDAPQHGGGGGGGGGGGVAPGGGTGRRSWVEGWGLG